MNETLKTPQIDCDTYILITKTGTHIDLYGDPNLMDFMVREHHKVSTQLHDPDTLCRFDEKIFGIGLLKTATCSLTEAMNILGYKSYHEPYYLDRIWDFDFVNDMPIAVRYKFLDAMFPNAKFILTIREMNSWIKSIEGWWKNLTEGDLLPEGRRRKMNTQFDPIGTAYNRFLAFNTLEWDADLFIKKHKQHIQEVKEHFKGREEKLLILDICGGDDWIHLCNFLNRPIPIDEFPCLNTKNKPV